MFQIEKYQYNKTVAGRKVKFAIETVGLDGIKERTEKNWKQFIGQKIITAELIFHINGHQFRVSKYTTQAASGKFYDTLVYKGFEAKTEKAIIEIILKDNNI